jgi:hypothetical protein
LPADIFDFYDATSSTYCTGLRLNLAANAALKSIPNFLAVPDCDASFYLLFFPTVLKRPAYDPFPID